MQMTTKTAYANGVTAFGGERITLGDLMKVANDPVNKEFWPKDAVLIGSADEEGNRFGFLFTIVSEKVTPESLEEFSVPGLKVGDTVIVCTPAV
jgi:hypothetical protein